MTIGRDVTDHERDRSGRVASLEALIDVAQTFLDRPQRAAADAFFFGARARRSRSIPRASPSKNIPRARTTRSCVA